MMLSTVFLSFLMVILLPPITITFGTKLWSINEEDNKTMQDRETLIEQPPVKPLNNDVTSVSIKKLEKLNDAVQNIQEKLDILIKEERNTQTLQDQMKSLEKKLENLQRAGEDQEMFGTKLTALEFTLNHVLSKVVYLSDNTQPRLIVEGNDSLKDSRKVENEVLNRLGNLLHHIQNVERNNCRRSSIPAAAGPIVVNKAESLIKLANSNGVDNQNFFVEELLRKLELRLNTLSKLTNLGTELKQLPLLIKQNGQQLTRILDFVNQLSNEDSQQHSWQRMLEYCQGVSDEFSTFAGSSDVLLKRIESVVQDTKERIDNLQNDADGSSNNRDIVKQCVKEKTINSTDETREIIHKKVAKIDKSNKTEEVESINVIQAPNKSGCHDLISGKHSEGIYAFNVPDLNDAGRDFNLRYCKFSTDKHPWTVIQRRGPYDVQENFNRSWVDYRNGFGDLNKDFWFGNEFIHRLTYFNNYELLIELENFEGDEISIFYGTFGLDSERVNFNLFVGDYKGPGPDSMSYHNFMDFSTFDRHNDKSVDVCCPCAIGYGSGWWFDNCLEANLNGLYRSTPMDHNYVGIIWEHWLGDYSLKATRMLIRPKNQTSTNVNIKHEDP